MKTIISRAVGWSKRATEVVRFYAKKLDIAFSRPLGWFGPRVIETWTRWIAFRITAVIVGLFLWFGTLTLVYIILDYVQKTNQFLFLLALVPNELVLILGVGLCWIFGTPLYYPYREKPELADNHQSA